MFLILLIFQCHIRLKTPEHARILVDYFSSHHTVQSRGLDDTGIVLPKSSSDVSKAIKLEVVQGKREELYWEKVPAKIRQQALLTASELPKPTALHNTKLEMDTGKRSRKRRKH